MSPYFSPRRDDDLKPLRFCALKTESTRLFIETTCFQLVTVMLVGVRYGKPRTEVRTRLGFWFGKGRIAVRHTSHSGTARDLEGLILREGANSDWGTGR